MLGNFKYSNPTTLYFGKDALNALRDELKQYGPTIMLSYGGGSIKRNGIYDAVIEVLQSCGKHIVEDAAVMPNPTAEKLREGRKSGKSQKSRSYSCRRWRIYHRLCKGGQRSC